MGTSGNRKGYKVFSINTTVRNPQRNLEFLRHFQKFNGLVFDSKIKMLYFIELVRSGVYQFSNISNSIKEKLLNDIPLNEQEIKELFEKNPQATGFAGRVMTQLRALKDQGFLIFSGNKTKPTITMTNFAFELINGEKPITDIYTKMMIGLHSRNPARTSMLNKARVFLNTIFVIDLLKKEWQKLGNEAKGILKYEFSFVLGMKDCDYKKCVKDILTYRKLYGLKENKDYIKKYLFDEMGLENLNYQSLSDYTDEVFRKFEMTGLLIARGKFGHIYYDFSTFNLTKIQSLLREYKGYKFKEFKSVTEYIDFLSNIKLPWLINEKVRKELIENKAKNLEIKLKENDFSDLNTLEETLNQQFYNKALQNKIVQSEVAALLDELRILASLIKKESQFESIPEPLRLEYLLALILGKKYGIANLTSNLIYNENGTPLSYAPAGKADLTYQNCLFEATMIKNKNQQLNSETTSIARHMKESVEQGQGDLRTLLIAPYIHWDVALFFKFCAKEFESKIAPITIANFINLVEKSEKFSDFKANFDKFFVDKLTQNKTDEYIDFVNFRE